jgi:hypothetical protein
VAIAADSAKTTRSKKLTWSSHQPCPPGRGILRIIATFIALILTNSDSVAAAILNNLALLCLDVAIAIAVMKYRLYEIDRIISRTLAYAIVTGLLIGVYAGLVLRWWPRSPPG